MAPSKDLREKERAKKKAAEVKDSNKSKYCTRLLGFCCIGDAKGITNLFQSGKEKIDVLLNSRDLKDGNSGLHLAIMFGHEEVVKILLEKDAPVNVFNKKGLTPLHFALLRQNPTIVDNLLESGANVNYTDPQQRTPLFYAIHRQNEECLELLLKHGADVERVDFRGYSPLHECCVVGWTKGVSQLVKAGSNVNKMDLDGNTPLHIAAEKGVSGCIAALLGYGASIDITNKQGNTPHQLALNSDNYCISNAILKFAASGRLRSMSCSVLPRSPPKSNPTFGSTKLQKSPVSTSIKNSSYYTLRLKNNEILQPPPPTLTPPSPPPVQPLGRSNTFSGGHPFTPPTDQLKKLNVMDAEVEAAAIPPPIAPGAKQIAPEPKLIHRVATAPASISSNGRILEMKKEKNLLEQQITALKQRKSSASGGELLECKTQINNLKMKKLQIENHILEYEARTFSSSQGQHVAPFSS